MVCACVHLGKDFKRDRHRDGCYSEVEVTPLADSSVAPGPSETVELPPPDDVSASPETINSGDQAGPTVVTHCKIEGPQASGIGRQLRPSAFTILADLHHSMVYSYEDNFHGGPMLNTISYPLEYLTSVGVCST